MKPRVIGLCVILTWTSICGGAGIAIEDTTIDAAPDQHVTVFATGEDLVQGLNLFVQVHGAPLAITDMSLIGTIFEQNNAGPYVIVGDSQYPDYGYLSVATAVGTVFTPGIICVLTIDATGLAGQAATITANTDEIASDYAGWPVDAFQDATITVRSLDPPPVNQPPVVEAGACQTVVAGSAVGLTGQATDPEAAPMTYLWTQTAGPSVTLLNFQALSTSFTAPQVTGPTSLEFNFFASDGASVASDHVTVNVNPSPAPDPDDGTNPPTSPTDPPVPPADPPPPPTDPPVPPPDPPVDGNPDDGASPGTDPGGTIDPGNNTDPGTNTDPGDKPADNTSGDNDTGSGGTNEPSDTTPTPDGSADNSSPSEDANGHDDAQVDGEHPTIPGCGAGAFGASLFALAGLALQLAGRRPRS
jgi:hypothetical protein